MGDKLITYYNLGFDTMLPISQEVVNGMQSAIARLARFRPWKDIQNFHAKFGLEYDEGPRALPHELADFRTGFMVEELCEYITDDEQFHCLIRSAFHSRVNRQPLEKQLDALVDLVYVALGTAYLHGFDFEEAWRRVHAANMSKVRAKRAEDSVRGSTFDVVKPPGWKAPDLSDLVDIKDKV